MRSARLARVLWASGRATDRHRVASALRAVRSTAATLIRLNYSSSIMLPPSFSSVRIARVQKWAEGLRTIELEATPTAFLAGQFFQLGLVRGGEFVKRSYSAAFAPGARAEFLLSLVEGGALTPGIFELEEGDELGIDFGALGFFTLREVPDCRVLWLLATGTGLGPYISMLREAHALDRFERIVLVHGARTLADHAYAGELRALALRDPRFTYLTVTSREASVSGGLAGRITTAFSSGELERAAGVPIDADSHILFCGNPQMIEEMVLELKARGLRKHRRREPGHFNFEKYW